MNPKSYAVTLKALALNLKIFCKNSKFFFTWDFNILSYDDSNSSKLVSRKTARVRTFKRWNTNFWINFNSWTSQRKTYNVLLPIMTRKLKLLSNYFCSGLNFLWKFKTTLILLHKFWLRYPIIFCCIFWKTPVFNGPSYWKLNETILDDNTHSILNHNTRLIRQRLQKYLFKKFHDAYYSFSFVWDLLKWIDDNKKNFEFPEFFILKHHEKLLFNSNISKTVSKLTKKLSFCISDTAEFCRKLTNQFSENKGNSSVEFWKSFEAS